MTIVDANLRDRKVRISGMVCPLQELLLEEHFECEKKGVVELVRVVILLRTEATEHQQFHTSQSFKFESNIKQSSLILKVCFLGRGHKEMTEKV